MDISNTSSALCGQNSLFFHETVSGSGTCLSLTYLGLRNKKITASNTKEISNVETEKHYVSFLYNVIFPFRSQLQIFKHFISERERERERQKLQQWQLAMVKIGENTKHSEFTEIILILLSKLHCYPISDLLP